MQWNRVIVKLIIQKHDEKWFIGHITSSFNNTNDDDDDDDNNNNNNDNDTTTTTTTTTTTNNNNYNNNDNINNIVMYKLKNEFLMGSLNDVRLSRASANDPYYHGQPWHEVTLYGLV